MQIVVETPERFRLDMGYPERRVGAEFDGREYHSSVEDRSRDARRRAVIEQSLGWRIVVARREDVLGRSMLFEETVAEALGIQPATRRRLW